VPEDDADERRREMSDQQQSFDIQHASYGKDGVRVLIRTLTDAGEDRVLDLTMTIAVEGTFLASYRSGDNTAVLPSDTFRLHALAACRDEPVGDARGLLAAIADRLLAADGALTAVTVGATHEDWTPRGGHTFTTTGTAVRSTDVTARRDGSVDVRGGLTGLRLLITTGSAFTGFMRDELTTQLDATDRPLCGTVDASWTYAAHDGGRTEHSDDDVIEALTSACSDRPSNSVQQLLTEVGGVVLAGRPDLSAISLRFASTAIAPIGDGASDGPRWSYEIGSASRGITEVTLTRSSMHAANDTGGVGFDGRLAGGGT
jgi:urate oxidase